MIASLEHSAHGVGMALVDICEHCQGQVWGYYDWLIRCTYIMHNFPIDDWKDNGWPLPTEEHLAVPDRELALTPVRLEDIEEYWRQRARDWCDEIHAPRAWEKPE